MGTRALANQTIKLVVTLAKTDILVQLPTAALNFHEGGMQLP